ncbi:16S rRNA (cytosine(1402)-N(4))-methyltransferase RsmH [Prosthecochloris sp. SCSIO W1101]|uniref:16S rRNA (cytosine(1402)-N(4))-methyltransferase RsmH n=1 Tax=Prosthecochloris sp. SCSIO W1101 TaxID=2992242 RepID=UPI00223C9D39|nr:16S rRNA (cytosine(1402)-N(4))-methyltransferase RsmH [Prosthecochloris sp. SCSIO W1101]UZJ41415.1 16S rRNA (cytosine(1402)-N(4))-methyltransferase RsmH [Prosthecochloris sp. SCSIO W1101]
MSKEAYHRPVMVREVVAQLVRREGIYVDGTLGGGGHSLAILQALQDKGFEKHSFLIGIDQDSFAIEETEKKLMSFREKTAFVQGNFRDVVSIVNGVRARHLDGMRVAGMLFDLGVSSFQIDTPERGFSYLRRGPLDMRMRPQGGLSASDIVNDFDERNLADIFFRFGEEQKSRRIARAICSWRKERGEITDTEELAAVVRSVVRGFDQQVKSLARVFQALRIAVNDELGALEDVLRDGVGMLGPQGRMGVISYHSLEDRMVKRFFRKIAADDWGPKGVGLKEPLRRAEFRVVTGRPEVPSDDEVRENPRARSAKLRVVEKKEQSGG